MHCSKASSMAKIVQEYLLKRQIVYLKQCLFCNKSRVHPNNSIISKTLFSTTDFCSSETKPKRRDISNIPTIKEFLSTNSFETSTEELLSDELSPPYLKDTNFLQNSNDKNVYFETYGCQMNVNDAEYAWAILKESGYKKVDCVDKVCCLIRLLQHKNYHN